MRKLGIVAVLLALSAALWATSASPLSSPRVFSLLSVTASEQQLGGFPSDRPPVGGDQFAFVDDLYRWAGSKKGARVGRVQGIATFVTGFGPRFTKRPTVLFTAQAFLPGGSVMVEGYGKLNPDGPSRHSFPVVGGTGVYSNARGFVKVRDLGDGESSRSNLEFHLLP